MVPGVEKTEGTGKWHSEAAKEVPLCSIVQISLFTWNLVLILELGLSEPKNWFHAEPGTF